MEGVAEDDFGTGGEDILGLHGLDRPVGTDRHERRSLDGSAREAQLAAACHAVLAGFAEAHAAHAAAPGCSSMAFKEFSEDPCVIVHVSCRRMRKFNKEMTFFFIVKQNVG